MRSNAYGAVSWVLVLIAASSLFSMIGLLQINRMVHQDLFRYGLDFSYQWAMPYWTITMVVFALVLFNIIAAVAFQIYLAAYKRKEATAPLTTQVEEKIFETETTPTEPVEEQGDQGSKPIETVEEEPKETPVSVMETGTQEKKEETQTEMGDTSGQEQTESKQPEQAEQQKEEEPKPTEEPQAEQKETEPETQESGEETPIIVGVSQEELQSTGEETQQQS